jgi:hypothetical protein
MLKPQTASALHQNARKIIIYTLNGVTQTLSASSIAATNSPGTYSLSAVFTTTASTTGAKILFYNGSYDLDDIVYWDNMGLYPITASSSQYQWVQPLTLNDRQTIKFDGRMTYLQSSASISQPYTLYVVGRTFNNSVILGNSSSALLYSKDGYYYFNSGSAAQMNTTNKEFNIYTAVVDSGSATFYFNGQNIAKKYVGYDSIYSLQIGRGTILGGDTTYLSGDISSILLFNDVHNNQTRLKVESWLDESLNLIHDI